MGKELTIEKLRDAENYHTWSFAVKNLLALRGFEKCIEEEDTETNAGKLISCKATISLTVEPNLYVHIMNCPSALEIWKVFKQLYDEFLQEKLVYFLV